MFALAGAMATFSINDMLMKLTAQRYPLGEVITVRGVMATLLVGGCLMLPHGSCPSTIEGLAAVYFFKPSMGGIARAAVGGQREAV